MTTKIVQVTDQGRRVGESHPNAKMTDDDVALLLALWGEGWGYKRLCAKFEISKRTVRGYTSGKERVATAAHAKRVRVIG